MTRILVAVALTMMAMASHAQTLKIATLAPEGSQWVAEMRAGAKTIRERTDGRVQLKLYAGGVMGNDNKVLRKMRIGQLHGAYFTATSLQEQYPDLNIYGLPFLYRSEAEVDHVRASIDAELTAGLLAAGYESFGFSGGGFARLMSQKPVTTLADLDRQKIWVPEGDDISFRAMQAMGLSPVILPVTDVLTGLQSGLLDIVGSPPVAALVLQWHTKVKYVTDLPLVYTIGYLAIDKKAFARLSAADQVVVREVLTGVSELLDAANKTDNVKALDALASYVDFVNPEQAAVLGWQTDVLAENRKMAADGLVSSDLLMRVERMLADYRAADESSAGPGAAD
ncbi:MAG: TRAP transporter substrate-binding protein DctP [Pseudomonadota bacterium]